MTNSGNSKLTEVTEKKVLALLARGDTGKEIAAQLKAEDDIDISPQGILAVGKRNAGALSVIKNKIQAKQTSNAVAILDKSRNLIEKRLNRAERLELLLDDLAAQFAAGEIDADEYLSRIRMIPSITLTELSSVAKEAFNQSQVEAGALGALPGVTPAEAQAQLAVLVKAIQSGDEVELQRIVFNPKREALAG